ncbi:hypothetical protein AAFP30_25310 [Gordonia sp. CPCC 205515]|uniref:hypothetical protein n=1 Tax=Gordonia sp. CPCC 205515 TaxID=3140791 RepID=UPI003AF383B2
MIIIVVTATITAIILGVFGQPSLDFRAHETRRSLHARERARRKLFRARPEVPAPPEPQPVAHRELSGPWIVDFASQIKSTR